MNKKNGDKIIRGLALICLIGIFLIFYLTIDMLCESLNILDNII